MVALLAPPTVEARFDLAAADRAWTTADLDATLGPFFTDRDPDRNFAATDVLNLS